MRGMVDLNKSGSAVTLAALSAGNTGGGTGKTKYFEKYLEMGSPFDAQTEDEQEEDVLETSVSHTLHFSNLPVPFICFYFIYFKDFCHYFLSHATTTSLNIIFSMLKKRTVQGQTVTMILMSLMSSNKIMSMK